MAVTCPLRLLKSPITSPMYSSGVTTSTAMMGSSNFGEALGAAWRNAWRAAISNDRESESTGWNEPSLRVTLRLVKL